MISRNTETEWPVIIRFAFGVDPTGLSDNTRILAFVVEASLVF